jgi:hypothetical protein
MKFVARRTQLRQLAALLFACVAAAFSAAAQTVTTLSTQYTTNGSFTGSASLQEVLVFPVSK